MLIVIGRKQGPALRRLTLTSMPRSLQKFSFNGRKSYDRVFKQREHTDAVGICSARTLCQGPSRKSWRGLSTLFIIDLSV